MACWALVLSCPLCWALCPGLILLLSCLGRALELWLASVARLTGEECGRTNRDVNADKNSLMKQFILGMKVGPTKKSIFFKYWFKPIVLKQFGIYTHINIFKHIFVYFKNKKYFNYTYFCIINAKPQKYIFSSYFKLNYIYIYIFPKCVTKGFRLILGICE